MSQFFVGRHPYADNTAWISRPFTTLIGGKGLPPYQMSQLFVGRHPYADKRGLQPVSADALSGGKGLPPYFYQVNEGSNYHKAFFIFPHKTMNRPIFSLFQTYPPCRHFAIHI